MGWTCAAAAIFSPNRLYTPKQVSMSCTICLVAWHAAGMLADGCSSPDTLHGILLAPTFGYFSTNITWYYSFWKLLNITRNIEYCSILSKITQYYQYYSILPILLNIAEYYMLSDSGVILEWSWILLRCYQYYSISPILPIYQYYQYYTILHIKDSPILINITFPIFRWWYSVSILLNITNITQYYLFNITQYS